MYVDASTIAAVIKRLQDGDKLPLDYALSVVARVAKATNAA